MEEKDIKKKIEQFFNAELSVEEERELCRFLRENDVPACLQKDKEAIIALCGDDIDVELPSGAVARLEAVIDSLDVGETQHVPGTVVVENGKRRLLKIPRYVWSGVAAVALLVIGFSFYEDNQPLMMDNGQPAPVIVEVKEVDTFDNPEDAMECFKGAFGNVMFAVNATHKNSRKMENNLNKAVAPYKNMIKIKIQ